MDGSGPTPSYGFMPGAPMAQKWEQMKPIIHRLYIHEGRKLEEVIEILRIQFGFDAVKHQMKYHIRQWKFRRCVPKKAKKQMYRIIQSRAATGKSTTIEYKGQPVEDDKLIRHAENPSSKSLVRQSYSSHDVGMTQEQRRPAIKKSTAIFSRWNMPYGAMRHTHFDVLEFSESPCSGIVAITPSAAGRLSPPTDLSLASNGAALRKLTMDRAHLFMGGYHRELISSMSKREQIVMSTWLHQFWLFAYRTARHWGRGPRNWTSELLEFHKHPEKLSISAAPTPSDSGHTPQSITSPSVVLASEAVPTDLCNWAVHAPHMRYEALAVPIREREEDAHDDLREWKDWPGTWLEDTTLQDKFRDGLASNSFSEIEESALPIAIPHLLQSANLSADELLDEALVFSIIGRNCEALDDALQNIYDFRKTEVPEDVYPFHLAASYLDGSGTCCSIFETLASSPMCSTIKAKNINHSGHTILDNLMIAILRSHTNCVPGDVDDALKSTQRFEGEEVSICGRWDADSDTWLALIARGEVRAPFHWKHKFCHTSVQVICHCTTLLFGKSWSPKVDERSGLFRKKCQCCKHVSRLLPLHAMVMTTVLLAEKGCAGEDLFGMLACFLCLLRKGADATLKADISVPSLVGGPLSMMCTHRPLNAAQLAESIPMQMVEQWPEATRDGWRIIRYVLDSAAGGRMPVQPPLEPHQDTPMTGVPNYDWLDEIVPPQDVFIPYNLTPADIPVPGDLMEDEEEDTEEESLPICDFCEDSKIISNNISLRNLWLAVQAEILTYRRLQQGDPWLSPRFNLSRIVNDIDHDRKIHLDVIDHDLLKEACACGSFTYAANQEIPCVTEVCKEYIANMEDWHRTTFLTCPDIIYDDGYAEEMSESGDEDEG